MRTEGRVPDLVHELLFASAGRSPDSEALRYQAHTLSYQQLAEAVAGFANYLRDSGIERGTRVAIYLEKRFESVIAMFGASAANAVFVPVNPQLKAEQVAYILRDCNVKVLVTSPERLAAISNSLDNCPELKTVILTEGAPVSTLSDARHYAMHDWTSSVLSVRQTSLVRTVECGIDHDMAAILYTSGSTGQPKGVVLSHRNIVAGANSVAQYLCNTSDDRILCVLPLSFDYGMSQLTTAFLVGACAVLINHLLPRDIVRAVVAERITGLAAVPPLWSQVAQLDWSAAQSLRYLTNSGGVMPTTALQNLRKALPEAQIFLMYGLTEAFRSTYLPPALVDSKPGSIGRAIPNAEVMVVRSDGSLCDAGEHGELVHRGALVALGYWNDLEKTQERFRPAPQQASGLTMPEMAVWSGDTVYRDEEGYLYFVGRSDDMLKVSGYRVSPSEIEDVLYALEGVQEAAVFGLPHPDLGHEVIAVVVAENDARLDTGVLQQACLARMPRYMLPSRIVVQHQHLPRNPNGKIDRKGLRLSMMQSSL